MAGSRHTLVEAMKKKLAAFLTPLLLVPAVVWAADEYKSGAVSEIWTIGDKGCVELDDGTVGVIDLATPGGEAAFRLATSADLANRNLRMYVQATVGGCWKGGSARTVRNVYLQD